MRKHAITFFFFVFCAFSTSLKAQPPNPDGGGGGPGCFPPPCIPVDGGLSWLLLAGAAYGGKKMFDINKNKTEEKVD